MSVDQDQVRLTLRETQVLRLVARGMTSRAIASRLFLSRRTVEHHVQRVLTRTGCRSRAALVNWAHRNGIVA